MCCNDKNFCLAIWFRVFDYQESKEEKERRKRNKSQSNQPKCNSDVTHNLPVVTSFYFPWRFAVFLFFWQIFFHLSSLFFCCHEISYRLDFSFRCEATFVSPRIIFFIFVSVSCIRSGRWIHQIHSGGQTSYKIRQKCVDRRKPRAAMFVVNFSPFKSRASFARFSRAWRMRVTNSPARKLVPATFTLAFSLIRNPTKCSYITGWCSSKMLRIIFRLIVSVKTFNEL